MTYCTDSTDRILEEQEEPWRYEPGPGISVRLTNER